MKLHHVTLRTPHVADTVCFFQKNLGMREGVRPPFNFAGAWLYPADGAEAILHLIEDDSAVSQPNCFDHFAMMAKGVDQCIARLKENHVVFTGKQVPDTALYQIHFYDPNGIRIELTFDGESPTGADEK